MWSSLASSCAGYVPAQSVFVRTTDISTNSRFNQISERAIFSSLLRVSLLFSVYVI
ncbi:hypothetical protein IV57_GL002569 [Companilactobacillus kimchiensis]|uniref:Uncharacterized protein n=1 Tax=Companilactobacillus kimchiensis TaxID=993692 RepID=A0A0R2LD73_9LACO|nr:hypothetical protein IV57_GL002569 [Companilactobacillus kimchiensis]